MSCSVAKSRIILDNVAVAMSLFGVKWLGTRAIFDLFQTLVAPLIFRNSVIATAAESSFAITKSSSMDMMSPGATASLPAWAARIFSVMVIGRAIAKPPHGSRCLRRVAVGVHFRGLAGYFCAGEMGACSPAGIGRHIEI